MRQHANRAPQEVRLVGVPLEDHVRARVIGAVSEVDAFQVLLLVPLEDVADVERGHDVAGAVGQCHLLAGGELGGQVAGDGEREGDGPGVLFALVNDEAVIEHLVEGGRIHRAHQRAEGAIAKAIDRRQVGVRDRHLGEPGRGSLDRIDLLGRHRAIDRLLQTTMHANEISHRSHPRQLNPL